MARLGFNVEPLAAMREQQKLDQPDPVAAAVVAELAGADSIICHLRQDRRFLKEKDIYLLKEMVKSSFNLRMPALDDTVQIAAEVQPDRLTLVPEIKSETTRVDSLDVLSQVDFLDDLVGRLNSRAIAVGIAVEPDVQQVKAAARIGAEHVEINASYYAAAADANLALDELERLRSTVLTASKLGLGVALTRGLDANSVYDLSQLPHVDEFQAGYAVFCRGLMIGLDRAVRDMVALVR